MNNEPIIYKGHEIKPERFGAVWKCRISGPVVNSVFGVLPTSDKAVAYAKRKIDQNDQLDGSDID